MHLQTKTPKIALTFLGIIWVFLTGWWVYINYVITATDNQRFAFGAVYGVTAIFGAIYGIRAALKWGGTKSSLGKALLLLGLGLVAAEFGQLVFSYYNIVRHVDIPYPSIADVGFFGSIPFYVVAATSLAKVTGLKFSSNSTLRKVLILLLPIVGLTASYMMFLRGYVFSGTSFLRVVLDFGYPLGQALYISIILIIFFSSVRSIGGLMKHRLLLLLAAYAVQYCSDFNFVYQSLHGTWVNGAYGDYLYLLAYTLMALTLVLFSYLPGAKTTIAPSINSNSSAEKSSSEHEGNSSE